MQSSASASEPQPSSFACRCASAQVGKCTCESVKPGTTQRPPRSTRSGPGSAVSCADTPPATSSPAIASERASGSEGSIVLMTPFSRITETILPVLDVFDHVVLRVSDFEASRRCYELALGELGYGEPYREEGFAEWEDLGILRGDPVTRN